MDKITENPEAYWVVILFVKGWLQQAVSYEMYVCHLYALYHYLHKQCIILQLYVTSYWNSICIFEFVFEAYWILPLELCSALDTFDCFTLNYMCVNHSNETLTCLFDCLFICLFFFLFVCFIVSSASTLLHFYMPGPPCPHPTLRPFLLHHAPFPSLPVPPSLPLSPSPPPSFPRSLSVFLSLSFAKKANARRLKRNLMLCNDNEHIASLELLSPVLGCLRWKLNGQDKMNMTFITLTI